MGSRPAALPCRESLFSHLHREPPSSWTGVWFWLKVRFLLDPGTYWEFLRNLMGLSPHRVSARALTQPFLASLHHPSTQISVEISPFHWLTIENVASCANWSPVAHRCTSTFMRSGRGWHAPRTGHVPALPPPPPYLSSLGPSRDSSQTGPAALWESQFLVLVGLSGLLFPRRSKVQCVDVKLKF